jgi:endonuclease/exonuclease/phosphatase family metal-dependent hydrolase
MERVNRTGRRDRLPRRGRSAGRGELGRFSRWCLLFLMWGWGPNAARAAETTEVTVRVMAWNIHHGEGLDGKVDLGRIAEVIRSQRVDVVGLQEVDKGVARTGGRDFPAELAALTGMTAVFANNFSFQGGEYGNAILTRFPLLSWTNRHYRMIREGEQRGLLEATLRVGGHRVRFLTTHIDHRPDDSERWSNVAESRGVVEREDGIPTVLCGDFNDLPGTRVYEALTRFLDDAWVLGGSGMGYTYPASGPSRRIDYIFLWPKGTAGVREIGVVESTASDHLPVAGEFRWVVDSGGRAVPVSTRR